MKRRQLLIITLAGALAGAAWRFAVTRPEDGVLFVLRKRLGYLKLDEAGLQQFARDIRHNPNFSGTKLRWMGAAGFLSETLLTLRNIAPGEALLHSEERLVSEYLLSTDFFSSGADTSKTVHYLGPRDPLTACSNPFGPPLDES